MQNKKWIIALVLGLLAGSLHFVYVRDLESKAIGGARISVLAVTQDIRSGEKINTSQLGMRQVPGAYVDDRVVRADKVEEIVGLSASVDLASGQMLQWTDVAERLDVTAGDLAKEIASGKRAVTIPVDRSLAMGGMLRPGHRVDILGTFAKSSGFTAKERVTVTLLQNVKVVATGGALSGNIDDTEKKRFNTVTLSVGLEDAQLLSLASSQGKLSLVLRGRQDLAIVQNVPEADMAEVWANKPSPTHREKNKKQQLPAIERLGPR
ncbi:MAG: Flp pilus assembly protein CpaB [Myxococcota bacterium]|nr:Flp pilus assembly protein CpaB [Myxococcota bacterium]